MTSPALTLSQVKGVSDPENFYTDPGQTRSEDFKRGGGEILNVVSNATRPEGQENFEKLTLSEAFSDHFFQLVLF